MKPITAEWVAKAEGDFLVASQIMRRRKHRVLDATCFQYRPAKDGDHFAVRIQEKTGHKVTDESEKAAIEWFVKWLKP